MSCKHSTLLAHDPAQQQLVVLVHKLHGYWLDHALVHNDEVYWLHILEVVDNDHKVNVHDLHVDEIDGNDPALSDHDYELLVYALSGNDHLLNDHDNDHDYTHDCIAVEVDCQMKQEAG